MSLTVRETIFANVMKSIQEITKANGFDNTVFNVQRYGTQGANDLQQVPAVIIKSGNETRKDDAFPLTSCVLELYLLLFIRVDEDATDPPDLTLNSILGDIIKKLKIDLTRGGLALDTAVTNVEPFESIKNQSEFGLIITVEIEYRHSQTDPKTAM